MHNKNDSEYGKENIKMKDNDTAIEQTVFFFRRYVSIYIHMNKITEEDLCFSSKTSVNP